MEKLKPLLAYKFWFAFPLAILLPATGWLMATGGIANKTLGRTKMVEGAMKEPFGGANTPNEDWAKQLNKFNVVHKEQFDESAGYLWRRQKGFMTWPESIAEMMEKVPYWGPVEKIVPYMYRDVYQREIWRMYSIVDPYYADTGEGTLSMNISAINQEPSGIWDELPPSSEAMWNAQEDIWIQTSLLEAVAAVNTEAEAKMITESPIKVLSKISLIDGGNRLKLKDAKGGGGRRAAAPSRSRRNNEDDDEKKEGEFSRSNTRRARRTPRGGNRRGSKASANFPNAEEFGKKDAAAGGRGAPGGRQGGKPAPSRYITVSENKELPFKVRGFKLELIMDHRAIPQLLTQLTQMKPWPTQIIRAQMIWENPNSDLRRSTNTNRSRGLAGQPDSADAGGGRRDFLTSALADPYLAHVVVAGLMTIYLPPKDEMAAQPGAAEKPAAPAETATPEAEPLAGSEPGEAVPNESGQTTTPPDATATGAVPAPESTEAPTTESDPTPSTDPVPDSEPANGTEPATDSEPAADSEATEDAAANDENTNTPVSEPEGNP